ncbi:MAG: hypothetical protein RLZ02_166, partial [Actinomycetota bacterium]
MTRGKTLAVNLQVTEQPTRKLLWQLMEPSERRALGGLFSLMLVGTLFETLSVGLLIPVLSVLTSTDSNIELPFGVLRTDLDRTTLIGIVVVGVFFVYVIKNVFLALSVWIQRGYLTRLTARFGSDILKSYVLQPFAFHLKKNSSTLIRNTQDASVLVAGGIEPLLTVTSEGLIAVSLFLVLVIVEPLGTLLVVGSLVLATMLFQRFSSKRLSRWGTQRQFEKGKIIQTIQQSLGAVKDVQVLGRENWFIGQHEVHQQNDARLLRKIITVQSLPRLWLEVMAIGGLTGLVGVMLASGKDSSEIVPVVGLFAATAFRVLPSINKIVGSKQQIKVSRAAIETIYADLH